MSCGSWMWPFRIMLTSQHLWAAHMYGTGAMDCWDHLIFYALPLAMVIDKLHQIMKGLGVKMNIINWLGTWIENDALRSSSREEVNLQNQRSNHGFNQLLFIIHKNLLLPRQKTMACRWRPKSKRALREHRQKKKKKRNEHKIRTWKNWKWQLSYKYYIYEGH